MAHFTLDLFMKEFEFFLELRTATKSLCFINCRISALSQGDLCRRIGNFLSGATVSRSFVNVSNHSSYRCSGVSGLRWEMSIFSTRPASSAKSTLLKERLIIGASF